MSVSQFCHVRWYGLNSQYHVTVKMAKRYYCLLYIVFIGSDRPLLRDLHNHVMTQAAHKWRDLGIQLLEYYQIDIIEATYPRDDVRCCMVVLKRWLETSVDASWNQLIRALRSPGVQLDHLVDQLEQMMRTECKMYSNTVVTHSYKLCIIAKHISNWQIIVQQVRDFSKIPHFDIRMYIC